jgi:hypothetical protein
VKKKLYLCETITFSHLQKKVSKNHNNNWHHRNLPELPIVPCMDFGPLGVKMKKNPMWPRISDAISIIGQGCWPTFEGCFA